MDDLPTAEDWARLGLLVRRSREALGLTQSDIDGASASTITKIEAGVGANYRGQTLAAIERAVQWGSGSIGAILAGGDPVAAGGEPTTAAGAEGDRLTRLEEKLDAAIALLREVAERG